MIRFFFSFFLCEGSRICIHWNNAHLQKIAEPWKDSHSNQTCSKILSSNNNIILYCMFPFGFIINNIIIRSKDIWRLSIILPESTTKKANVNLRSASKYRCSTNILESCFFLKSGMLKLKEVMLINKIYYIQRYIRQKLKRKESIYSRGKIKKAPLTNQSSFHSRHKSICTEWLWHKQELQNNGYHQDISYKQIGPYQ